MKLSVLAIAAAVGLALAAPSAAYAHSGHAHTPKAAAKKPAGKKVVKKVVAPKNIKGKLNCAKPVMVKGKPQCPTGDKTPAK
jgi:hypothetical protein